MPRQRQTSESTSNGIEKREWCEVACHAPFTSRSSLLGLRGDSCDVVQVPTPVLADPANTAVRVGRRNTNGRRDSRAAATCTVGVGALTVATAGSPCSAHVFTKAARLTADVHYKTALFCAVEVPVVKNTGACVGTHGRSRADAR